MIKTNDLEHRFLYELCEITERTNRIRKMINRGFLDSVPCHDEMDLGLCWIQDLKEVNKLMDTIEEGMLIHQAVSDNYPLDEECPF